ncbi:peroxidase family protein [Verrucomicrobiales bacterium]|nr:peroxidase family protein [Verrucomicrobiales bacterium]MDC0258691.1 peroxidase family protein [Verrucomicrobiales bacterium]MDC0275961.1 peroxidase family protein [Verrucomicrobiales bacterium]MDC0314275.1 peroxidase family protein [bacterium]
MKKNYSASLNRHLVCIVRGTLAFTAVVYLLIAQSANAQQPNRNDNGSPNDFRKNGKRGPDANPRTNAENPGDVKMGIRTIVSPKEFRTIDGSDNNLTETEWGKAEIPFLRMVAAGYADGTGSPSGEDRPNARAISNAVSTQEELIPNRRRASDFLWQWGQFLDHDITLTPTADPVEPFNVEVPAGDPHFDPQGTGVVEIPLDRSFHEDVDSVREQLNEITAYIDASNVYGSNSELASELRTNDGTGMLKTSEGDLLPFNVNGFPNAGGDSPKLFLAGDFRVNEQSALSALHTLFLREHNYWAGVIAKSNDEFSGDQIYEVARAIVGAEMQVITYNEFLPMLMGPRAFPLYSGYKPNVNPGITNVFATASYRFGHTMLSSNLMRIDRRGRQIEEGHLDLAAAFFNPSTITDEGGIDPFMRGLATQTAQEIDTLLVDDVRNFFFRPSRSRWFRFGDSEYSTRS